MPVSHQPQEGVEHAKATTGDFLRVELQNTQPRVYHIPEGKILTPATREYLQQRKIEVAAEGQPAEPAPAAAPVAQPVVPAVTRAPEPPKPKYVDYETDVCYVKKPEHMTQLLGNVLVTKDHLRTHFRGEPDSLQALVVLNQVRIVEGGCQKLVDDLGDILGVSREVMHCNMLDETFENETIIGLTYAKLQECSRNPQRFFGIQHIQLPDYTVGRDYALLNQPRATVRETEVTVTEASRVDNKYARKDIIRELNRLPGATHITMCMHLTGQYH